MPRVAGVDPGSVSFDLCVLQDGQPVLERVFESGSLRNDPAPLLDALGRHGPYDLIYGPSGYGVPLVAAADVDELRLAQMVLVRPDERGAGVGIAGMRTLIRELAHSGLPVVFGPGVIHLPSVPRHRKYNRIDLGTADKVCSVAYAIVDQASRMGIGCDETSFVLVEFGGAFTAAVAVASGQIVDGAGGSSGPIGVRASGALDGELAYLLAPSLSKRTLFSGGALGPVDAVDLAALWDEPAYAEGWAALLDAAAKAVRGLAGNVPGGARGRGHRSRGADRGAGRVRSPRRWRTSPRSERWWPVRRARPRTGARCWPTGWPADDTSRSSRRWVCARRPGRCSITSAWPAPRRFAWAESVNRLYQTRGQRGRRHVMQNTRAAVCLRHPSGKAVTLTRLQARHPPVPRCYGDPLTRLFPDEEERHL